MFHKKYTILKISIIYLKYIYLQQFFFFRNTKDIYDKVKFNWKILELKNSKSIENLYYCKFKFYNYINN